MAKVKEEEPEGAPAYFGLFCSLMTVMLAFFILMTTMADKQESGFKNGIGDIRNAFGLRGGFGLFSFAHLVRGSSKHKIPEDMQTENGVDSVHEDMTTGKGGSGNTDESPDPSVHKKYLRIAVPHAFKTKSHEIGPELGHYLQITGTALALMDYNVSVKCYTNEYEGWTKNRELAFRRAAALMFYLNQNCRVPFERMQSFGYSDPIFASPLDETETTGEEHEERRKLAERPQIIWIDIYEPAGTNDFKLD